MVRTMPLCSRLRLWLIATQPHTLILAIGIGHFLLITRRMPLASACAANLSKRVVGAAVGHFPELPDRCAQPIDLSIHLSLRSLPHRIGNVLAEPQDGSSFSFGARCAHGVLTDY